MKKNAPRLLSRGFSICIGIFIVLACVVFRFALANPIGKGGTKPIGLEHTGGKSGDGLTTTKPSQNATSRTRVITCGRINKGQVKEFTLDLLFPYEGTFRILISAEILTSSAAIGKASIQAANTCLSITMRKDRPAEVRPLTMSQYHFEKRVSGVQDTLAPAGRASWDETVLRDSLANLKESETPRVVPIGPAPDDKIIGSEITSVGLLLEPRFLTNPIINEPSKLILRASVQQSVDQLFIWVEHSDSVLTIESKDSGR